MSAKVNESMCTGCGICADVCPVDAITINQVAKIDAATCIDCGACVTACPRDAISMEEMEVASSSQSSYSPPPSQEVPTTRNEMLPNSPLTTNEQPRYRRVDKGGLLGQIFNFFGGTAGQSRRQGRGQGRGQGKGGGGGMGRGKGHRTQ